MDNVADKVLMPIQTSGFWGFQTSADFNNDGYDDIVLIQ